MNEGNKFAVKCKVFRECLECGVSFCASRFDFRVRGRKFCSRKCGIEYRKKVGWMPESFTKGRHGSITRWSKKHIEAKSSESE